MSFTSSKLEKLTIVAYETNTRQKATDSFEAMFNPTSYSLHYKNEYDPKQGHNTMASEARYTLTKPEHLSIRLIIDGTGVDDYLVNRFANPIRDVYKEVARFLDIAHHMNGDIHEPNYLTLKWGDLTFKCRLGSAKVNYTLFDRGGRPLRAELDTEFFGDIEQSDRVKQERKNSPDLTHYRIVGAHDRLPLMCEKIYGDPRYYVYVAQANGLDDFRNLTPGQEIYFPPIAK